MTLSELVTLGQACWLLIEEYGHCETVTGQGGNWGNKHPTCLRTPYDLLLELVIAQPCQKLEGKQGSMVVLSTNISSLGFRSGGERMWGERANC